MTNPTTAQLALLTAISDYTLHITRDLPTPCLLATHPAVQALGLSAQEAEAELKAGGASGLFMLKKAAGRDGWALAYRGQQVVREQNLRGEFFAPAACPPVVEKPAPAPAAPVVSGYQPGDARYLAPVDSAPQPGSVVELGGEVVYVSAHSKGGGFYLPQRTIDDEDLFEFEGVLVTYVYHRPATAEQVASHRAEQERLAARTPAEQLAEEPVTVGELMSAGLRGALAGSGAPEQGERLAHEPGYDGANWITLYRTPEGLAVHTGHNFNDPIHHMRYELPAERLTERQRLGLAAMPTLAEAAADDDEWETL